MAQNRISIQIIVANSGYDTNEVKEYELFIATLFSYQFLGVTHGKIKKIVIELFGESDILYFIPATMNSSLYTIRRSFDFTKFTMVGDHDKKIMLLEVIRNSLIFLFEELGQDTMSVENACDKIIENDFRSEFVFNQPKLNKEGNTKAFINIGHTLKYALVSMIFLDSEDKILRKIDLFKTLPSPFIYSQLLGAVKWLNNNEFQLSSKTNEYSIRGSVDGSTSVVYSPKNRNVEDVKEEIRLLTNTSML